MYSKMFHHGRYTSCMRNINQSTLIPEMLEKSLGCSTKVLEKGFRVLQHCSAKRFLGDPAVYWERVIGCSSTLLGRSFGCSSMVLGKKFFWVLQQDAGKDLSASGWY